MKIVLTLENVHASIGQYQILQGVNLTVPEHQVTVLLGRNGAGKSTTLRTIMGYVKQKTGQIRLNESSLLKLAPFQVSRKGISYLPEEGHIFANLTVQENLRMAMRPHDQGHAERVEKALSIFPDLRSLWKRPGGHLSGGQKQMLAMATLLVANQPLLLIDEPSKGLSPAFVEQLKDVLLELKKSATILLVEQNFSLASRVGDTFTILDDGRTVLNGSMPELVAHEDWQQQYLGVYSTGGVS